MCLQGGCVVVDLVKEHMVRVAVLEQDVLTAARLLYARRCVLENRGFEFLVRIMTAAHAISIDLTAGRER
jgi:hypothetical protein